MPLPLSLPVTTFVAVPMALLMVVFALRIGLMRRATRIGLGVHDNKTLAKLIAAHGNMVDNIPLGLLLFALAEIQGANTKLLTFCGIAFIIARSMNALGVSQHAGHSFGRFYGIALTWFVLVSLVMINVSLQFG